MSEAERKRLQRRHDKLSVLIAAGQRITLRLQLEQASIQRQLAK